MKIGIKEITNLLVKGWRKLSLLRNAKSNSDYVRAKKEIRDEKRGRENGE